MRKLFLLLGLMLTLIACSTEESTKQPILDESGVEYTTLDVKTIDLMFEEDFESDDMPVYKTDITYNIKPGVFYTIRIDCLTEPIPKDNSWVQTGYGTGEDGRKYSIIATTRYSAASHKFVTTYTSAEIKPEKYNCK